MKIDVTKLPNTVESLQALIVEQLKVIQSRDQRIDNLEFRVHQLDETLKKYLCREFGRSADVAPQTNSLFNEAEQIAAESPIPDDVGDGEVHVPGHTRARGKRKPLPADIEREIRNYDLSDADKFCSDAACGCALKPMGVASCEQLDIIPAKMKVIVHNRRKYACPSCQSCVKVAVMPRQPIMKSLATPGTLAHVAVCKFEDALPLYRQEKIFERLGIDIPRATMARWMIACGTLVRPLIEKIRLEILAGQVVHMDETPIQVLKEKGRNPWDKSYMWVMARGSPRGGPRAVIYSYHISRSQIVVEDLLRGYAGHVQSDEFSGYNLLDRRGGITRIGCWAHVRRQFTDALKTNPRGGSGTVANEIITKIKFLYDFERDIKDLSPEEVVAARRARSLPVLANLKNLEEEYSTQIPPKSATGKALTYMRNAWSHLTTYVDCGYADIDNNYVERAIRPFTTGRKNWLFADTPAGAHASAALYSLVETAKANKIDPYQYLKRVFTELPQIAEGDSIDHLLPWNLISETLN
jgi:transposase